MVYVNRTGLPSVTTALSGYIESEWVAQEYLDRGTAVHDAAHAHLLGRYVVPLRSDWQGYFDSFKRWCDEFRPQVEMVEERLKDDVAGFCGQPDFIGRVQGRIGLGLIDWKTSLAVSKWHRLQGAAYRYLARKSGKATLWGGNLRLRSNGGAPLFDPWPDDFHLDYQRFQCALTLHRYFNS